MCLTIHGCTTPVNLKARSMLQIDRSQSLLYLELNILRNNHFISIFVNVGWGRSYLRCCKTLGWNNFVGCCFPPWYVICNSTWNTCVVFWGYYTYNSHVIHVYITINTCFAHIIQVYINYMCRNTCVIHV